MQSSVEERFPLFDEIESLKRALLNLHDNRARTRLTALEELMSQREASSATNEQRRTFEEAVVCAP